MDNYNIKNRPYGPLWCAYPTLQDRCIFEYNSQISTVLVMIDHCLMANYMMVNILL